MKADEGTFGERLRHPARREEILRYLLIGSLNFVATFLVFYTLNRVVQLQHHLALALTWLFALLFNYALQITFVFRARSRAKVDRSFFEFAIVYGLGYLFNGCLLYGAVDLMRLDPIWSQAAVTPLIVGFNYLAVRFVVLRPSVVRKMSEDA